MSKGVKVQWVIGAYEGEQAKLVIAHADHGIGYFMLEQGGSKTNPACMVAFRLPDGQQLAENLQPVMSPEKVDDLNKRYNIRHHVKEDFRTLASANAPESFKSIMGLKK